jgi:hypothetical protein
MTSMRAFEPRIAMSRRPPRTLVSGLGVATAVLAGVLLAVTFASGLIGLRGPGAEPRARPQAAVAIEGSRAPARVRPAARRSRATSEALVSATRTTAAQRDAVRRAATARPKDKVAPAPPPPAAETSTPPPPPAGAASPPRAAPPRARAPLEPLGNGVDRSTDDVAATLRELTSRLGEGVAAVIPPLGGVVARTGDALGDIVAATGDGLSRLLGAHPAAPR